MITDAEFRRMALAFEGAVEKAHMNHPDFRVHGAIFATLHGNGTTGMVKLPLEDQPEFLARNRDAFAPAASAWGRQGCTIVRLASVGEEELGEAMTLAWRRAAARPAGRARGKTRRR